MPNAASMPSAAATTPISWRSNCANSLTIGHVGSVTSMPQARSRKLVASWQNWLVAARLVPPEDEAPAAMMRTPWQHRLRELKMLRTESLREERGRCDMRPGIFIAAPGREGHRATYNLTSPRRTGT